MTLELQPITYAEACVFISEHHRHHLPPQGWKFGVAVNDGERVVGVITVGRPVARMLDDGWTLEVTRCCTDGTPNVPSKLYGAAARAAFALGYKRLITYTLSTEPGTSLIAANWRLVGSAGGGTWNRAARPRVDVHPRIGRGTHHISVTVFLQKMGLQGKARCLALASQIIPGKAESEDAALYRK